MFEPNQSLREHLLSLEAELQTRAARTSAARLGELLAPDFREFGRSGAAYAFDDIVTSLINENRSDEASISEFAVVLLAKTIVLATYRGTRSRPDGSRLFTNRSSIWRHEPDGRWRMVFHQGTPTI